MKPEGSLPRLQKAATCPYPDADQSSPRPTTHLLKIHLNIILPSMPGSSKWYLSPRFPQQYPVCTSFRLNTCCVERPSPWFDYPNGLISGVQCKSLSSSLCTLLHCPVDLVPLIGSNILLGTQFSNTLSLRSSLNVRDQVSHPTLIICGPLQGDEIKVLCIEGDQGTFPR